MIARTSFLPRLFIVVGLVSGVTACNGRIVSLGNTGDNADKLTAVDPTTSVSASATTTIDACPAGFAHPNICCDSTPGASSTCGEWTLDPFRACSTQGASWSTYPNAFECCDLTNPTACIETPVDAGATAPTPPPAYGCGFICPPGWWPINGVVPVDTTASGSSSSSGSNGSGAAGLGGSSSGGTTTSGSSSGPVSTTPVTTSGDYGSEGCCRTLADGTSECTGFGYAEPVTTSCASGGGSSSGSVIAPTPTPGPIVLSDGGLAYPEDAGIEDAGITYVDDAGDDGGFYDGCEDAGTGYPIGYDGGSGSLCGACPAGWSMDANDPLLCCQQLSGNVFECFSQATGSASGIGSSGDNGSVSSGTSSPPESGSSSGSTTGSGSSGSSGGGTVIGYPADAAVSN